MAASPDLAETLLPLAFSLHSTPGAYAVLAGAGLSHGAVPVAWEVLTELIGQAAAAVGEDPPEQDVAETWYQERFGEPATYEAVLSKVGTTQVARQAALTQFFDTNPPAEPTAAHRSIARLVKAGVIQVIVTMNFDHLLEDAIRAEGLRPVVISTESQAAGHRPLHTLDCCIVHLHGEYQDPSSLRNTIDELADYGPRTKELLQQILRDYGLIVIGWSAEYDPALREAIEQSSDRLTPFWIEPSTFRAKAQDLLLRIRGAAVHETGAEAFGHLSDAVTALAARKARHPLALPTAIETTKQALSGTGQRPAIDLHDRLTEELKRLHAQPDFHHAGYKETDIDGGYMGVLDRIEEASKVPAAMVAALALWGTPATDIWWIDEIERLSRELPGMGDPKLLQCPRIAGSRLLYAAGIGAVAAERWDLLARLLTIRAINPISHQRNDLLATVCGARPVHENIPSGEARHFQQLSPVLLDALAKTGESLDAAWERFELIRMATELIDASGFFEKADQYNQLFSQYEQNKLKNDEIRRSLANLGSTTEGMDQQDREGFMNQDRALGVLSHLAEPFVWKPHVLMVNRRLGDPMATIRYTNRAAEELVTELTAQGARHPLAAAGVARDAATLIAAFKAINHRLSMVAERAHDVVSELWLDSAALSAP